MSTLSKDSTELTDLMICAKKGDREAYSRVYEELYTPLYRYILWRVRDGFLAEDLTQTVFLKVLRTIKTLDEQRMSPRAYFFTVARNTIIDHWRTKKEVFENSNSELFDCLKSSIDVEKTVEQKEIFVHVCSAIETLDGLQYEVILMRFIQELTTKEIAEALGKSEVAIRQLQCRALKCIREKMSDVPAGSE